MQPENQIGSQQKPKLTESIWQKIFISIQLLQWIGIIFYCIFSQSIQSSIALLFLLIDIKITFNQYYVYRSKNEVLLGLYFQEQVKPKKIKPYLWIIFIFIQLGFLIFKMYYFIGSKMTLSQQTILILELENPIKAFVPTILIITAIPIIFVKHNTKKLSDFYSPIDHYIIMFLHFILICLLVFLQLFNLSIFGMIILFFIIALVIKGKWNFRKGRWIITALTVISALYILFSFTSIMLTDLNDNQLEIIHYLGLYTLLPNQIVNIKSQGFIACLILVYFVCILFDRYYIYQKIHSKSIQDRQNYLMHNANGQSKQLSDMKSPEENINQDDQQYQQIPSQRKKIAQQQVRFSNLRQLQLPQFEDIPKKERHRSETSQYQSKFVERKLTYNNAQIQQQQIQQIQPSSPKIQKKQSATSQKQKKQNIFGGVYNYLLKLIRQTNTINIIFRLLQLFSIVLIQRYNTIYSCVIIIWLIFTQFYTKMNFLKNSVLFVLMPMVLANYLTLYYYNIPYNFIDNMSCGQLNCQVLGFSIRDYFWVDILIFNLYIYWIFLFIKRSTLQIKKFIKDQKRKKELMKKHKNKQKQKKTLSYFQIFLAILFKYSYLLTLFIIYWISFSSVNIINLIFILIFLIFFSSGQQLIEIKKKINNKKVNIITSFTYQYWYIVIIYTGIIILLKYVYFLIIPIIPASILNLTGINQQYDLSFNFSFTKFCQSNTTPFFIIYIFAALQYSVSRSKIYMEYTFSLMTMISKKEFFSKRWQFIQNIRNMISTFYYQSLFIISGIIVLICNNTWSINGILIGALVAYGIIFGFGIGRVWKFIMWINLIYIFSNYFLMFVIIDLQEPLKPHINNIIQFSLMLGAFPYFQNFEINQINPNPIQNYDIHFLFIKNIIIFILSVSCNQLYQVLRSERISENNINISDFQDSNLSSMQGTIMTQNLQLGGINSKKPNNEKFVLNFRLKVIYVIQRYYYVEVTSVYEWFNMTCNFIAAFITDISLFFILMCALYFRLSISMFLFLCIYLTYYFIVFTKISRQYRQKRYYNQLFQQLLNFANKIDSIYKKPQHQIYQVNQNYQSFYDLIYKYKKIVLVYKLRYRKVIWKYSALLSFICIICTYSFQFFTFPLSIYPDYYNNELVQIIQKILFIIGVSSNSPFSLWRQIYFYFFISIINCIQRLLIQFLEKQNQKQERMSKSSKEKQLKNQSNIIDLNKIIEVEQQNQEEVFVKQLQSNQSNEIQSEIFVEIDKQNCGNYHIQTIIQRSDKKNLTYEGNILIFYTINNSYMKIIFLVGILSILLRFYVTLLLFNSYEKSNIFSWVYLGVALVYWIKTVDFSIIQHINRISIYILLLQYLLLLLNITSSTCPYYPFDTNLSLIQLKLTDQNWLNYLGFGKITTNNLFNHQNPNIQFIMNSFIIFATDFYYTLFHKIALFCYEKFHSIKIKYDYIIQQLQRLSKDETLYINYQNYKSMSYKFLRKLLQFVIINSHLIVALIILEVIVSFSTVLSIILLIISSVYFFLAVFSKNSNQIKVNKYTYYYFYLYKMITFAQLFIISIFNIPFLIDTCSSPNNKFLSGICNQIKLLSIPSEIFLLFIIQLWFDLESASEYKRFSKMYYSFLKYNQAIMSKAATYRLNNRKLIQLKQDHDEILEFEKSVRQALRYIQEWHKITKKQYGENTQILSMSESSNKSKDNVIAKDANVYILDSIRQYLIAQTNPYFYLGFTNIMLDIQMQNIKLMGDVKIDIKHYILENFQQLQIQLIKIDKYYKQLFERLSKTDKIKQIVKQQRNRTNITVQDFKNQIIVPESLDLSPQRPQLNLLEIIFYYILTKFNYIVTFFLVIYYTANPCMISLPIIILVFSYEILSDYNIKNYILIYIIIIVIMAQIFSIVYSNQQIPQIFMYFFFSYNQNANANQVFSTPYLNFLFVLIFLNQIIIKYSGFLERYPAQIENQYQAFIRNSINNYSKFKISKQLQKISQKLENKKSNTKKKLDVNPTDLFYNLIQKDPSLLKKNKVFTIYQNLYSIKSGVDLYPIIASIQVLIIIYLIFFFPLMMNSNKVAINSNLKYSKFSAPMIILILINVFFIIAERKITLIEYQVGKRQMYKLILTILKLIGVIFFVYWFAPYDGLGLEKNYYPKPPLIFYMLLQFLFFTLSIFQIKQGYKKYKKLNSIMNYRDFFHSYVVTIFVAIPFLLELKLLIDWTFSKTSLQLSDWTCHFNIYLTSFQAKINSLMARMFKLGQPMPFIYKLGYGWIGFLIILLFIFGPMILFSNLNPASQPNLVINGQLQIGIQIVGGNYFPLYTTSHFATLPQIVSQNLSNQLGFNNVPTINQYSQAQLDQQFQEITYFQSSDNFWEISTPNYDSLISSIRQALTDNKQNYTFQITVNYQLFRSVNQTLPSPASYNYPFLSNNQSNNILNKSQLQSIYQTLTTCSSPTTFQNFYISLIQLDTAGSTFKPRPIIYSNTSNNNLPEYLQNITMTLICNNNTNSSISSANSFYWNANLNCDNPNCDNSTGLILYVLCDKYQSLSFGYSFIGLYTSVILVIATYVRGFFNGNISMIPYLQNPQPEYILNLCEAIAIIRMRQDLQLEYLMYYELVDIMRSPEVIKYMCGSYTKMIKEANEQRIKEQNKKIQEKQKQQ